MTQIRFCLFTALLAVALVSVAGCGGPREATDPEVTQLIRQLRQGKLDERCAAAEELGRRKHPRAVAPLILSLGEPQASVCQAAAIALGKIGDKQSLAPLLERLTDPELTIRY